MGYVAYEGEWVPRVRGKSAPGGPQEDTEGSPPGEPPFVIGNEFAYVTCRKVFTRNGERLEIAAPKIGMTVLLDAIELEALTGQPTSVFSELIRSSGHEH